MPFNAEQLAFAANHSLNFYQRNNPVDQINVDRPLIQMLMGNKREYVGGLQYVQENLRITNSSNFQSYFGSQQVTYNRKRTLANAKFQYGSFHDGYGLDEDELVQNGITMVDDRISTPTDAEKVQLVNLLEENNEALMLGFKENFDIMLHRDGTQSTTDIPGLSSLIALDPTAAAVVGGIDQSTTPYWRNYYATGINGTTSAILTAMETAWRETTRYGGSAPNFILCGGAFYDAYRTQAGVTINRRLETPMKGGVTFDAGVTGVYFKGVPLIWDPVFDIMDTLDAPAIAWAKRCYFINKKYLWLRPIKGHWMQNRKPPRVYDRYVHYVALTAKAALTTNKRNAHAVLSIA